MKNFKMWMLIALIWVSACKPTENPDTELLNVKTFTVQNQLNATSKCMMDLYNGVAYSPSEAAGKQSDIDFIFWQYTGTALNKDCYFRSPLEIHNDATGAGQQLETDLGIDTWTVWKDAVISNSDVTETQFDAMDTRTELLDLFSQNTHGLVNYSPISDVNGALIVKVFIFQDKSGRKGFLKVKSISTGTTGSMSVEVRMIK